ncbi:TonB-dependent receptor [Sphingobacteriales bacterium UPWRP_1]|nr:hypothetical protein BVG80_08705 [Sphingobacteriales bacterium TSM_CSM]PSJ78505.1 TonB-dependent receptor [Sphingobacteriales bacterium UPWRP_1]
MKGIFFEILTYKSRLFFLPMLLCLHSVSNMAQQQTGSLEGKVHSQTGVGLTGVTVTLQNKGTVTDSLGNFNFLGLTPGRYTLALSAVTIEPLVQTVVIKPAETTRIRITAIGRNEQLKEIEIRGYRNQTRLNYLNEVQNNALYAGKKTEAIQPSELTVNLAINPARQLFAKTPGISVWENDGSGIQTGIASRGLSPNRSWEFNVRQNGYDISPDVFGYPEAYYSPPSEAVEQIQVVRGAASLQYGPQFGGLLNYQLKKGSAVKPVSAETRNTVGSNGLFNSFTLLGGTRGKLQYTTWFHHRSANGWRQNSRYHINTGHVNLNYEVSEKVTVGAEYTRMEYLSQQPGGLTDSLFKQNSRQSLRARNWFSAPWNVANLYADITYGKNSNKMRINVFGLDAARNSAGFVAPISQPDTISLQTGSYAPRQVDRDHYQTGGAELRTITHYNLWQQTHTLAAGIRFSKANTRRRQLGNGSAGTDMDIALQGGDFARDLRFNTRNIAVFAENLFNITPKLSVTPGVRIENIVSGASGRLKFNADGSENRINDITQTRNLVLLGIGTQFKAISELTFYGNISQNYRPVLYSDLTPPANTDVIDPNLQDASGFNADAGIRGKAGNYLSYDISGFFIRYHNRIGTLTRLWPDSSRYQFRTNIGTGISRGVEAYAEFDPIAVFGKTEQAGSLNVFASVAFIHAVYTNYLTAVYSNGTLVEGNLKNKRIENAPGYIHRFGLNYRYKGFAINGQLSITGKTYADAANTQTPSANGQTGLIPAYRVMDVSAEYHFAVHYTLSAGINNLADTRYFTRRAGGYPGPGLLPADGRTAYVAFLLKL